MMMMKNGATVNVALKALKQRPCVTALRHYLMSRGVSREEAGRSCRDRD